jgi:hypothetical protein
LWDKAHGLNWVAAQKGWETLLYYVDANISEEPAASMSFPETEGTMFLWKIDTCLPNYTASQCLWVGLSSMVIPLNSIKCGEFLSCSLGACKFFKGSHVKILHIRWVTWSKLHTQDPQIWGVTPHNLVAWVTWRLLFVHCCSSLLGYCAM